MVYKFGQIFLPIFHNPRVWRTDRQTEFSSLDRVCIACSAVKTAARLVSGTIFRDHYHYFTQSYWLLVWHSIVSKSTILITIST